MPLVRHVLKRDELYICIVDQLVSTGAFETDEEDSAIAESSSTPITELT